MAQLEREGFVHSGAAPRHLCGAQDQARSDRDDLQVWAVPWRASPPGSSPSSRPTRRSAGCAQMFTTFEDGRSCHAKLDEYSEINIEFHQTIIAMGGNGILDGPRREPVHPYAHDPPQDDRREGPGRALDPGSSRHHPGAGGARHRAPPRCWCATTRSASPTMWRATPIIWNEGRCGLNGGRRCFAKVE